MMSRYARQLILPEIGDAGQGRLAAARVAVIGCGALGSMHAQLLARAGVGFLRLIDRDTVDIGNLHRQLMYCEDDVASGKAKVEIAAARLHAVNSEVEIEAVHADAGEDNLDALLDNIDVALDGTDNFATRHALNQACVRNGVRWVFGGVHGCDGLVMALAPHSGPCLRCVFPGMPGPELRHDPPRPIFPTAPAVVGALQATLAIKMIVGAPVSWGRLLRLDLWRMRMTEVNVERRSGCPACLS